MVRKIGVEIAGVKFPSLTAAAKACGTTTAALSVAVKRHGPVLNYIPRPRDMTHIPGFVPSRARPGDGIMIEGVIYAGFVEAAKCYGINPQALRESIWRGVNLTERFGPPLTREQAATMDRHDPVTLNGVWYPTVEKAAKALDVGVARLLKAIILGQGDDYALTGPRMAEVNGNPKRGRQITVGGVKYASVARLADATGLRYLTLWRVIRAEQWDVLEAMVADALARRAEGR